MAREVISLINVWCDNVGNHGTERIAATRTAVLAYDGRLVRLDVCDECRDEIASVLGEYAEYGETVAIARTAKIDTAWTDVEKNDAIAPPAPESAPKRPVPSRSRPRRPHQTASATDVRAWLREHAEDHGLTLPERGSRLTAELNAAYDRGHGWADTDGTWRPVADAPTDAPDEVPATARETVPG
ncbi:hypothetical protein MXD62_28435 [Frankia sp. Mgl5]|uniref:hypothetical protein n=1 Tax=Frankia sp. Mgl5 TaxID=2933793 RepID=UPI00200BCC15|nr:hypothetical protein [Frankia sp. Mgl5]MCK9931024.1 hypothetical protein [Frankia sp. Mgl5]